MPDCGAHRRHAPHPGLAHAAAQRTFVSAGGVDNPNCSLAAPCRSFASAIAATLSGGEVIVLDSAGYGPVTITKVRVDHHSARRLRRGERVHRQRRHDQRGRYIGRIARTPDQWPRRRRRHRHPGGGTRAHRELRRVEDAAHGHIPSRGQPSRRERAQSCATTPQKASGWSPATGRSRLSV